MCNAADTIQPASHVVSQRSAADLADSVDRNTPADVPDHCKQRPTLEGVSRTLALAHRLSYTSFAPPGSARPPMSIEPIGMCRALIRYVCSQNEWKLMGSDWSISESRPSCRHLRTALSI